MIISGIIIAIGLLMRQEEDTLSMQKAEQLLAEHNATVRISQIEYEGAEAMLRQSYRWENPEIEVLYNVYNPLNDRWFDPSKEGEIDISVNQPIPRGRRHRIAEAKAFVTVNENRYEWTLFTQKMEMKQKMCEIQALEDRATLIENELECLERILETYRRVPQGVSEVEVRRIETMRIALLSEQRERHNSVSEVRAKLSVALGLETQTYIIPRLRITEETATEPNGEHINSRVLREQIAAANEKVRFQKSLRKPAIGIEAEYDKNGNIGRHYWAIGVSVSPPIFDRNRYNIREAELEREKCIEEWRDWENRQEHFRATAAERLERARQQMNEIEKVTAWDISVIERQYVARNISLIEFIDLLSAYREFQELYVEARLTLFTAAIEDNLAHGREIHKIQ